MNSPDHVEWMLNDFFSCPYISGDYSIWSLMAMVFHLVLDNYRFQWMIYDVDEEFRELLSSSYVDG